MNIRGLHVNALTGAARDALHRARPALVKTLDASDDWADLVGACGIRRLIFRTWADDDQDLTDPEAAAIRLFVRAQPDMDRMRHALHGLPVELWWETPANEAHQSDADQVSRYAHMTIKFLELAASIGWRCAVGNWSVGQPEIALIDHFTPALVEGARRGAIWSSHDYGLPGRFGPGDDAGGRWWIARWARMYERLPSEARLPVFISEFGIDRGLHNGQLGGFKAFGMPPADYVAWLQEAERRELDAAVALGVPLLGYTLYCCGTLDPFWDSFDVAGVAEVEDFVRAGHTLAPAPAPPPPVAHPPTEDPMLHYEIGVRTDAPAARELPSWPYSWDQTNDWTTNTDQAAANNCGPESLAAAIYHLTGVELSADLVRDVMAKFLAADPTGYTTLDQLAGWLNRYAATNCQLYRGDASTLLRPVVEEAVNAGHPLIVLFAWDYNRFDATGHICPVVGYTPDGVVIHQVWGGGRVWLDNATFEAWQKYGVALRILRRRDAQLPTWS